LKIWFDVLTPKQLLFFEPMIHQLSKKNQILTTTRKYREASELAKIRKFNMKIVGKHGGNENFGKLSASIERMNELSKIIKKFKPNLTISFCSPDASRISFGLGIKHVGFCNAPHSIAVMKLSVPLLTKLLIPKHISKKEFEIFGINISNIIQYNAMDEYVIVKNKSKNIKLPKLDLKKKKNILFRTYETQASYVKNLKEFDTINAIKIIASKFQDYNIIVLGRYSEQIKNLKQELKGNVIILDKVVDSQAILSITDVFVGSGGTMTSESALRGIPTISYDGVPNLDEKYLVKKGLVIRCKNYKKLPPIIESILQKDEKIIKNKAKKFLDTMDDPYRKLEFVIKSL
jgi:predicted glycosyltransferase